MGREENEIGVILKVVVKLVRLDTGDCGYHVLREPRDIMCGWNERLVD